MHIPLLRGRDFTDADREGTPPVIVIDDVLAAKLWPGQNPLGKQIRMAIMRGGTYRWLEIIGVIREIRHFSVERKPTWMQVYVPQYQDPTPDVSFVINTTLPEGTVKSAAEKSVHEVDKDLPVESFQTLESYFDNLLSGRKVTMLLLSSFAGIGIVLGIIGIYGVVASSVIRRRKEIAIRMAVGATPSGALVLVTRLGLLATLAGIAIGSVIVISLARVLNSLLYGVSALDPGIYIAAAAIVILLALLASTIPAARLFRLNIQEILRQ
jgi:putative ABC transport system permease protein